MSTSNSPQQLDVLYIELLSALGKLKDTQVGVLSLCP